jgi:hypothetical protein
MLDRGLPTGRIQIDIKPYQAPPHSSFSLELAAGRTFRFDFARLVETHR